MSNEFEYQIENEKFNKIKDRCDISNILNITENNFVNTFFDDLYIDNGILVLDTIGKDSNLMESWKPILKKIAQHEQTQIFLTRFDKMDPGSGLMYVAYPSGNIKEFEQRWVEASQQVIHNECTECNHCQGHNDVQEENFSQQEADRREMDEHFSKDQFKC